MPDIGNIGSTSGYGSVGPLSRPSPEPVVRSSRMIPTETSNRGENRDRVELSEHARWLDALRERPAIRTEKVAEIKAAIANDSYESDEKLNTAIDRLLDDIAG